MGNPLIFFIVVIVIDLFLKSAKDKKKTQEARMRKAGEIKEPPKKPKGMINTFREEIEKELSKDLNGKPKQRLRRKPLAAEKQKIETVSSTEFQGEQFQGSMIAPEKIEKEQKMVETESKVKLDIKKEILKGVIYSEILSEPKSLQNRKRSI